MASTSPPASVRSHPPQAGAAPFSEAAAWSGVGSGWQPVFGSFLDSGFSVEWHEFTAPERFDWGASFHPGGLELCLNLEGEGSASDNRQCIEFTANTGGFYVRGRDPLAATRQAGGAHRFLTVEYSRRFILSHFGDSADSLRPAARAFMENASTKTATGQSSRLTPDQQQIVANLRQPPVPSSAYRLWYQCKVLELGTAFLFEPVVDAELFCTRQQRLAGERVEEVLLLLKQNLAEPLSLEELGRKIGCSPFYLSRVFSNHTGQTITQALRQLRLERAAELLQSGKYNVTEAAFEVGYSSLSHFSQAFHAAYGCCPGLYPIGRIRDQMPLGEIKSRRA
jgi:AraC-like DNA-binding protein